MAKTIIFFGHKHKKETKEKMKTVWHERKSDPDWVHNWTGRKHSEESKEKISNKISDWYKKNLHPMKGKSHTEQSKQNMRVPHNMSPEGSELLRRAVIRRNHFGVPIDYTRRDGSVVTLDSSYEEIAVTLFDEFGYEWERNYNIKIQWFDDKGKEHYYYPDFEVIKGGERYLVEVKGEHLLDDYFNICGVRSYAQTKAKYARKIYGDKYLLVSGAELEELSQSGWFN